MPCHILGKEKSVALKTFLAAYFLLRELSSNLENNVSLDEAFTDSQMYLNARSDQFKKQVSVLLKLAIATELLSVSH